ncbi:sensor domain-containing diguanylate cyclase [Roseibium suaedae]|uniref:diguanylate cyclase n=1 Tax=Roseibium suaedae TaxID=735517 RepID=A0A1M7FSG4_9HYPH|nr:GGDEF domain-containing protein [Roseibium suaedae]SHM06607.1 PAS domain S-box-containing protein/diguanylate cyclase (GGDEF) domain-containing protein [Roseibium suaedae]
MAESGKEMAIAAGRQFRFGVVAPSSAGNLPGHPDTSFVSLPQVKGSDLSGLDAVILQVSADEAIAETLTFRQELGSSPYLCICLKDAQPEARISAIFRAGADDVCCEPLVSGAGMIVARAQRALLTRRAMLGEIETLKARQAETQAALDNLPSPVFFKDRAGIYRGCNKAFEEFIGLPASKVIGSSVFDIAKSEYAQIYFDADERLMQAGGVQIYEAKVCYADGRPRDVSFHKAVTRDPLTGEVNGLAGAMHDITLRRELEDKLKVAAECDPLTGAFNRRKFFEVAQAEEMVAETSGAPLSVLAIDVDQFKQINDRFGHACGDAALCHMVAVCQAVLGKAHVFARSGGEEFFALLRNSSLEEAALVAENLRQTLAASHFSFEDQTLHVEVSIGVADYRPGESLSQTILRADHALYDAKEHGRNRVVTAPVPAGALSGKSAVASAKLRR